MLAFDKVSLVGPLLMASTSKIFISSYESLFRAKRFYELRSILNVEMLVMSAFLHRSPGIIIGFVIICLLTAVLDKN